MSMDSKNQLKQPWLVYQGRLIRKDAQSISPESREEFLTKVQARSLETGKQPDPKVLKALNEVWKLQGGTNA